MPTQARQQNDALSGNPADEDVPFVGYRKKEALLQMPLHCRGSQHQQKRSFDFNKGVCLVLLLADPAVLFHRHPIGVRCP